MFKRAFDFAFSAAIVMGVIFFLGAALSLDWLMLASAPAAMALVAIKRLLFPRR